MGNAASTTDQAYCAFCDWLDSRHKEIMDAENEALACVDARDADKFRLKMRKKAELLRDLPNGAEPLLAALDSDTGSAIAKRLRRFASSAGHSLDLDSVFYMSALLYNDDHKKGEPDNLQLYIEELRKS